MEMMVCFLTGISLSAAGSLKTAAAATAGEDTPVKTGQFNEPINEQINMEKGINK